MKYIYRQDRMIYRWPRRRWVADILASARSSSHRAILARQYNSQTIYRAAAYDTPFAEIPLPTSRNSTGPKASMLRPLTSERNRRLHEIGSKSMETPGADELESKLHHTDANSGQNKSWVPVYDDPAGGTENNGNQRRTGHDTDEGDTKSLEMQVALSDRGDSEYPLAESQREIEQSSRSQEESWLIESLRNIDEQALGISPESEIPATTPIHILGHNAVGKFFAHSLAGISKAPPVTLLVHHPRLLTQWYDGGCMVRRIRGKEVDERSGIDIQLTISFYDGRPGLTSDRNLTHRPRETIIDHLVVTTEGHTTLAALSGIRHRLKPSSTICFTQDSLAIIKYINAILFPEPEQRPNYIIGTTTHKVYGTEENYDFVEHRQGAFYLTPIPREPQAPHFDDDGNIAVRRMDQSWHPNTRYLTRTLCRTTSLQVVRCRVQDFYKRQFENMAITAVIGPLAVVHECFNSQLLENYEVMLTIMQLLEEISSIIRSFPEIAQYAALRESFGVRRLKKLVYSAITKSGRNRAPMLQDIMKGNETDIDFSTGYFLRRGRQLGVNCPRLDMITTMVKAKVRIKKAEREADIPFQRPKIPIHVTSLQ